MTLSARFRVAFALIIGLQAIFIAFIPLYFQQLGFSPGEIALLSSAENVAAILGPPLVATLAFPRATAVLSILSALLLLPILGSKAFGPVLAFWFFSLFLNRGALNRLNELAIRLDLDRVINYSRVRLWGSVSFVVIMQLIGGIVAVFGVDHLLFWCALLLLGFGISALAIDERGDGAPAANALSFLREGMSRDVALFFLVLIGLWAAHAPAYVYLSIHLDHFGWSAHQISLAWNIGVLSEILVFYYFPWFEKLLSLDRLITISLLFSVLRWFALGVSCHPVVLFLTQMSHAFTFALSFIASQKLVSIVLGARYRRAGQAFLTAATSGIGSLLGKLAAGQGAVWLGLQGDFSSLFLASGLLSLGCVALWSLRSSAFADGPLRPLSLFPESTQLVREDKKSAD